MPLSFLNPGLLFGAAAAALPVIIHFLSRRRVQRRPFSDLRFLDAVQARQARSLGVRRWLLLLLRVLAVLCLVAAAAGPRWGGLPGGAGPRSLLFLVDTSASMGTLGDEGARLERALERAAAMIGNLPGDTAVQVVTAGARTDVLFSDWLPAGAGAAQGLAAVQGSDGPFDLTAALTATARAAARAPGSPVEIVMVGDLQDPARGGDARRAAAALLDARDARFLLAEVNGGEPSGGVYGVHLPGRTVRPGESITLGADVIALQPDEVFVLEFDGRVVAESVADGPGGRSRRLDFAVTAPAAGVHRGVVRRASDTFAADDRRPFVFAVPEAVDVLLVHGEARSGDGAAGRGGWRYLAEALQPAGGPSPFRVTAAVAGDLTSDRLAAADVVVLFDCDRLGRTALATLVERVRGGGSVLVVAGDPQQAEYLGGTVLPALGLPAAGAAHRETGAGRRARIVDAGHPVFVGFDDQALGTLMDVPWRRWLSLDPGAGRTVVDLTGGEPLLVEHTLAAGRVAVLAGDLHMPDNELAASPMALPLFQRLTAWLAESGAARGTANALAGGEVAVRPGSGVAPDALRRGEELRVAGPGSGASRAADLVWRGADPVLRGGVATQAGFLTFTAEGDTAGIAAVAVPASETLGAPLGADGWRELLDGLGLETALDLSATDPDRLTGVLAGRDLAAWFLAAAALLLLAELRLGRGAGAPRAVAPSSV